MPSTHLIKPTLVALFVAGLSGYALAIANPPEGGTVWLSSLDLTKAHVAWKPAKANQSVDGTSLSLGGHVYEKGVGVLARTQMVIKLDHAAKRFKATVGIDDAIPAGKGSVEFRIHGDGRRLLWRSGIVRGGEAAKPVDVDVSGVELLTLVISEGEDGGDNDNTDLADARFEGVNGSLVAIDANAPVVPLTDGTPMGVSTQPEGDTPKLHAPFVTAGRPGSSFLHKLSVTGKGPIQFAAKGLPEGLTIDAHTGTISGKLSSAGTAEVAVTVTSAAGKDEAILRIVTGRPLALTPPMGWNSYDNYGAKVTESQFLANAKVVAAELQPFGWQYAVVDFLWFDPKPYCKPEEKQPSALDGFGRAQPAPSRFPSATDGSGFKAIADQVHALGLRFGIHIMRGIPRGAVEANLPIEGSGFHAAEAADKNDVCGWDDHMYGVRGDTPAGQAYYDSIFRLYAQWGIDYVKVDDISSPYHKAEIEAVRRAIDKTGRSIVLSLSPGTAPVSESAHLIANAELWRETGDFWDNWDQLEDEFHKGAIWRSAVGPGHWPDADMLPLGHISQDCVGLPRQSNFNHAEQLTLMTLWSVLPSPLMLGADLTQLDSWTKSILTNPEVLALNQDQAGAPGYAVVKSEKIEVWVKPLADHSLAVALFNRGWEDGTISVKLTDLPAKNLTRVRDLWSRRDLPPLGDVLSAQVPAHGAALFLLKSK